MTQFEQKLAASARQVEDKLTQLLDTKCRAGEVHRPEKLVEAMQYATLNGGKRLRPFLVMESGLLLNGETDRLINMAAAIECVHCYSLVHDDLPAMDDDDLRRGKPTLHKRYDEAIAILAGDGLLTLAFDLVADETTHPDPKTRIALVSALSRAAGIGGMVGGQVLDIYPPSSTADLEQIARMQSMKTGALIRLSCEAGAICADGDYATIGALSKFGNYVGQAFQLADDILDATSSAEQLGKQTAKDLEQGKQTQVSIHGVEKAREIATQLRDRAISALEEFGSEADTLRNAAHFAISRSY